MGAARSPLPSVSRPLGSLRSWAPGPLAASSAMLRTGKQVWEASAKRRALSLRQEELEFHISRFSVLITQCSVLAGFSFESIVHLEVPEDCDWRLSSTFFAALSLAVMFSLYVVVVGSCLVVFGYQLGLLGAEGTSIEEAVDYLRARRGVLFLSGFAGLICLVIAGIAMAWIKMGEAATFVTISFCVFTFITFVSVVQIFCAVGNRTLGTGEANLVTPGCVDHSAPAAARPLDRHTHVHVCVCTYAPMHLCTYAPCMLCVCTYACSLYALSTCTPSPPPKPATRDSLRAPPSPACSILPPRSSPPLST